MVMPQEACLLLSDRTDVNPQNSEAKTPRAVRISGVHESAQRTQRKDTCNGYRPGLTIRIQ